MIDRPRPARDVQSTVVSMRRAMIMRGEWRRLFVFVKQMPGKEEGAAPAERSQALPHAIRERSLDVP
ncbi:hypothetical protein BTR14_04120 [Rhizobium rhizosphaerae]|uniref:Uncharacterized protein n=1 Tax=Xaviernesmea rhizosphaerae TaxID=1672749 RepID=A0ABX3PI55_9HYPH|nr:hypothetical protein BTR14_04120 [Xaviernesmea rhizosphaerae]